MTCSRTTGARASDASRCRASTRATSVSTGASSQRPVKERPETRGKGRKRIALLGLRVDRIDDDAVATPQGDLGQREQPRVDLRGHLRPVAFRRQRHEFVHAEEALALDVAA